MATKQEFLFAEDVMTLLGFKVSKARSIIQQLNKELESQGYITFKGRVPKEYFLKRTGLCMEGTDE